MEKSQIKKIAHELIASNKLQEVFDLLLNFAHNDRDAREYLESLILISSRYNQLKKQSMIGVISYAELIIETNKIVNSLLSIISNLDEKINKVEIKGNDNIIIQGISGSTVNVQGNFKVEEKIANADEKSIELLIQGQSKIKILFLSSNPFDTTHLRLDKEMREIEDELIRAKYRDKFEIIKYSATRIRDLQDALLNHSPNIVHFSGHGNQEGIALLNEQTENTQLVPSEPLANLFKMFSNDIACVFLNSCFSESQAKQIKKFIPNIIGMKQSVSDKVAIEFAKAFYKALGAGREISFAFEFAKNSIDLYNMPGNDIPVML